jgi:hypothetical protein
MTAPNVTLDEQIARLQRIVNRTTGNQSFVNPDILKHILATLQSIKGAGDDVVEPVEVWKLRNVFNEQGRIYELISDDIKSVVCHIDTLLSAYKRARGKHAIEKQNAIHYKAMFEQAESEREQFRKDAERLDYLIDNCASFMDSNGEFLTENSREAIDSARNK